MKKYQKQQKSKAKTKRERIGNKHANKRSINNSAK